MRRVRSLSRSHLLVTGARGKNKKARTREPC